MCDGTRLQVAFRYEAPPRGETPFQLPPGQPYEREFSLCSNCGHYLAINQLDLTDLYGGAYADATYGDRMADAYERVMSLPPERSDNAQRVRRLLDHLGNGAPGSRVLDVGSGLGVFPARIEEAGCTCVALDPDARAVEHLRSRVGVEAVCADFMEELPALGTFRLITFNKVLEHVDDPVGMLARAGDFLQSDGWVYVEVPDGECAALEGAGREEFFIEHLCAFSMASLTLLARRAGFVPYRAERVREPSGKFTLWTLLRPEGAAETASGIR